jgi:hypothetical protein
MSGGRLFAIRRVAVVCIVVSLSLTAVIGIITLLGGDLGQAQSRVMLTTLVVGAFSVLALADLAVAGRRFQWCGYVGIAAAVAGLVMGLYQVWSESELGETFWKSFGIATVLAASFAHANLLLLLGGRRRALLRAGLWSTVGLIAVLTGMVVALILTDGDIGTDAYARILGTVAILDVLGTVVVPVLSRFLRDEAGPGAPGRLTVVFPDELSTRLRELAAERAMPVDAFVVKAVEDLAGSPQR